ncbi:MAG: HPr family phosphocarrier protein [Pseudoflavonifractor sp.]
MVSANLTVINKEGFHMRPAGQFVAAMSTFQSQVTIYHNGHEIDGKSIMNVMAACLKQGAELRVECQGPDEVAMLQAASDLIHSGLGEA